MVFFSAWIALIVKPLVSTKRAGILKEFINLFLNRALVRGFFLLSKEFVSRCELFP